MAIAIWLDERLRDLLMWPVNLVRDFPIRFARLLQTLWAGALGLVQLIPASVQAAQAGRLSAWLGQQGGKLGGWLHRLLVQLFDLLGGPEIFEFFFHLGANTVPLSGDEIAAVSSVLGPNALRYGDVRIVQAGIFDLIFKMNGNLAFATWHSINLPRNGRHSRANLDTIVHELTHVYQYERVGSRYLGEAIYVLIKTKRQCYHYGRSEGLRVACADGKQYRDFNREQQAQIAQDYFSRQRLGKDVSAYKPFITQLQAGEL